MIEVKQMELTDYRDIKQAVKQSMTRAVVSFVEIGFYLKKIKNEKLYLEDGYKDIWEAAENEFGLKRKQAWSFMNINDKYSVDGNSTELLPQYEGFSKSTLTEMLTLPDSDYELITEDTRIEDIRELKQAEQEHEKENKEEQVPGQISIMDMMPEVVPEQDKKPQLAELTQADAVKRIFRPKEMRASLNKLCTLDTKSTELEYWVEDFNPSGNRMEKVMPYFVFFYKYQDGVKIKNIVTQEITAYTYLEFCGMVRGIFGSIGAMADYWDKEFGMLEADELKKKADSEKKDEEKETQEHKDKESGLVDEVQNQRERENKKTISEKPVALKENADSEELHESRNKNNETENETVSEHDKTAHPDLQNKEDGKGAGEASKQQTDGEVLTGEVEENTVGDIAQNEEKFLKVREEYIDDIRSGKKRFTIRKNDRDYKVGQTYTLRIVRLVSGIETYLTDYSTRIKITYILNNFEGLANGYIAMGYEVL